MALFKILRGSKKNLETLKVTDGYAYFTPEDGKFYIDVSENNGIDAIIGNSSSVGANRICINPDYFILDCGGANGWINNTIIYLDCGGSGDMDNTNVIIYNVGDSDLTDELDYIIYDSGNSYL